MRIRVGAELAAGLAAYRDWHGTWTREKAVCKGWDLERGVVEGKLWQARIAQIAGLVGMELALYVPRAGERRIGPIEGRRAWLPREQWGPELRDDEGRRVEAPPTPWNGYSYWVEVWEDRLAEVLLVGLRYELGGRRAGRPRSPRRV